MVDRSRAASSDGSAEEDAAGDAFEAEDGRSPGADLARRPMIESELDARLLRAHLGGALFGHHAKAKAPTLGRFTLLDRLGRGATGTVYAALDPERGTKVALKLLTRTDATGVYRIKREFRSLSRLAHANLVTLHELFQEQGQWFFSMELVAGLRFDAWVRSGEPGTGEARLRAATLQLARAVDAIHGAGKLHCDLKPSNVLVTPEGRVVVLDFGLVSESSAVGDGDSSRVEIAGTPGYMAPEQAAGERPTTASDWYAVGVMLFEAMTGRLPFVGTPAQIVADKQRLEAPDPRPLGGAEYATLCELCEGLLAREAARRWDQARVFADLEQVKPSAPLPAAPLAPAGPPPAVFVGRERELETLRSALRAVRTTGAVCLLVEAPSGMGKSALLERFAAEITGDVLVLAGRCHEHESVPHKVFDTVVDALAGYLRELPADRVQALLPHDVDALLRLFPALGRVGPLRNAAGGSARQLVEPDPRELRNRAFAALKQLLAKLTEHRKVAILVDDLQWGDLDSAHMLAYVLGEPEPPPLLLIGAFRSDEVERSAFLKELLDPRAMGTGFPPRRLVLEPLPFATAVECARALLARDGITEPRLADELATETKGVPVFISELVQHVRSSGAAYSAAPRVLSLERAIVERVTALSEPARGALDVLSTAGGPLERSVLLEAVGLAPGDESALHALRAARLLRTRVGAGGEWVETYHDRIRETLLARLEPAQVTALHGRIAAALERRTAIDPERLVVHHLGAGNRPKAAAAAVAAARAAASKLAFNRAAELFTQAIELSEPAARSELYPLLGEALANAGRGALAAEALLNGAAAAAPEEARRLRCQAAKQYLRSGRTKLGITLAEQVLSEVGIERPLRAQPLLVQMLVQQVESLFVSRRFAARKQTDVPARARAQMEVCRALFRELGAAFPVAGTHVRMRLLRLAHETGDVTALLDALAWDAIAAAAQGGPLGRRRCKAALAKLEPVVEAVGTFGARALHQLTLSYALMYEARFAEAVVPARAGMQAFAELADRGKYWEENSLAAMYFVSLGIMGQVAPIVSEAQARRREARERDDVPATILLLLTECLGCLATDRPDDALDLLQRHEPMLDPDVFNNLHMSMLFRTVDTHLYCDRPDAALAYVDKVWPSFQASAYRLSQFARMMVNYNRARALVAVAARTPTRATLKRARIGVRDLGREDTQHARALAQLLRAALHHICGAREQALHLLATAERTFSAAGEMLYASSARVNHALIRADPPALQAAHDAMRAAGVLRPDLWARTWSPGFRS